MNRDTALALITLHQECADWWRSLLGMLDHATDPAWDVADQAEWGHSTAAASIPIPCEGE